MTSWLKKHIFKLYPDGVKDWLQEQNYAQVAHIDVEDAETTNEHIDSEGLIKEKGYDTFSLSRRPTLIVALTLSIILFVLSTAAFRFQKAYRNHRNSPFDGAFSRIPSNLDITDKDRRVTLIGMWNGDSYEEYLRHFFYSIQLNADVVDLVFINRLLGKNDKCLDFKALNVDVHWGGNVKIVCMDNEEWRNRYVNFLCSKEYGWDCSANQHDIVYKEFERAHPDWRNYHWRLFRGWVFRDLLPDNARWGWIDQDVSIGRLTHLPFNLLQTFSMVSFQFESVYKIFLAGQMTFFNFNDEYIASVWKRIPELSSVDVFAQGQMPEVEEEKLWSWAYLNTNDNLPGKKLSYALLPDLNGDDGAEGYSHDGQAYAISGRDIILMDQTMERRQIEALLLLERQAPTDPLGNVGWSTGYDASQELLLHPSQDGRKPIRNSNIKDKHIFNGILRSTKILHGKDCKVPWFVPEKWRQCLLPHLLEKSWPRALRASVIRFKDQAPGYVFQRLEKDRRPRAYGRKLIKHHHHSKKWLGFPPFEITQDMVMTMSQDKLEVFHMGTNRSATIYARNKDGSNKVG